MTTHDDLETRLRASLRERAGDVDTTPALYERVQGQANRGAWLRRGLALAGATAAVAVAVAVIPPLLPAGPLEPDILETPEDAAPTDGPTDGEDVAPVPDALLRANVAFADDTGAVTVAGRTLTSPSPVVSLAVSPFWTAADGAVVAGLEDGRIGVVDQRADGGDAFDALVDAAVNGGGVAFSPDGTAIAWIEGTDLHVLPLASELDGERELPLVGDVPDDLRIEQWFYGADAQIILASDPDGGVWRIPMDDSDAYNSAPTDPASLLPAASGADAVDAAILPDLSVAVLRVPADGSRPTLTVGTDEFTLGDDVQAATAELSTTRDAATLLDTTTGGGQRLLLGGGVFDMQGSWTVAGITAVAPLPSPVGGGAGNGSDDAAAGNASALGLPTGSPVIGTAGTDLLVRFSDGEVRTLPLYASGETEASLGRLAVLPGSTTEYGLVAVESFSEGETTIRFGGLRDGEVGPIGDSIVVDGPVTGLVWSEDGQQIAWTDMAGLHAATVDDAGGVAAEELLGADARPVLDWVWDEVGDTATGRLTVTVAGGAGVEQLGIARAADGTLGVTGPAGGSDRVVLDVHTDVGTAAEVQVVAAVGGGTAELSWIAAEDRTGPLAAPGQLGGDVRVEVSGGHVLVMGDSRQVLVTFDGEVVELPTAADWDVLD